VHGIDMMIFQEGVGMNIYFDLWDAAGPHASYFGGKIKP